LVEPVPGGWQIGKMVEGGDRGFLFRAAGLGLLGMAVWKILDAGGILGAGEQLLPNREAMAYWAPMILIGMFFFRGPLPARKSMVRVAGFQLLNLGFLALAAFYGLAAVPLGVDFSGLKSGESAGEMDWGVRDRLKEVEARISQIDREAAEAPVPTEGWSESKKKEMENRKQERVQQVEQCRQERSRLMEELDRRAKVWAEKNERERGTLRSRLQKAQTFCGVASAILLFLGLHGLVAGFISSGGAVSTGGFPVVSASGGKVENSIPGALRPKRPAS